MNDPELWVVELGLRLRAAGVPYMPLQLPGVAVLLGYPRDPRMAPREAANDPAP